MTRSPENAQPPARIDILLHGTSRRAAIGELLDAISRCWPFPRRVLIGQDAPGDAFPPAPGRSPGLEIERFQEFPVDGPADPLRSGIRATTADVVILLDGGRLEEHLVGVPTMVAMIREKGHRIVLGPDGGRGGATAYQGEVLRALVHENQGLPCSPDSLLVRARASGYDITEIPPAPGDATFGTPSPNPRDHTPGRGRRTDIAAVLLLLGVGLAMGVGQITLRPDLEFNDNYVLGESGNELFRSARLINGARLYRDVFCQYGPIPVYAHAAVAAVFGNTILSSQVFHLGSSLLCLTLAYVVLRRGMGVAPSLMIGLIAGIPLMLAPGGQIGSYTNIEYLSWERMTLLAVMLLWEPPGRRRISRSLGLGLSFGLWQGLKFGGAAFGMAAIIAVDGFSLMGDGRPGRFTRTARSWALIITAFALVEAGWIGLAYTSLPASIAWDTIWPAYIVRSYDFFASNLRYPRWWGLSFFIGQQMLPLTCGLVGLAMFARRASGTLLGRRSTPDEDQADLSLTIGLCFFAIAIPFYLKHTFHFYQYSWVLIFPGAWGFTRLKARWRYIVALACLPSLLLLGRVLLVNKPAGQLVAYRLPGGETIRVQPMVAREIDMLAALSPGRDPGRGHVVFMDLWGGGGYYHYFDPSYFMRNYVAEPASIRPYDSDQLAANLHLVDVFVISVEFLERGRLNDKIRATFLPSLASRIIEEFREDPTKAVGRFVVLTRAGGRTASVATQPR